MSPKEIAHCVTALCLFCRESVNRVKLREFGGLKLFVSILDNADRASLHDRILNSLLQFTYDDLGLRQLQADGLVLSLVRLLEDYTDRNARAHTCEEEICSLDEGKETGEEIAAALEEEEDKCDDLQSLANDSDMADVEYNKDEIDVASEKKEDGATINPSEELNASVIDSVNEEREDGEDSQEPSRFRVNSPSYQAVQYELEEYIKLRNEQNGFSSSAPSPSAARWNSPDSSSRHQSPDRSPYSWASSGYSPAYSVASASSVGSLGSPDGHSPTDDEMLRSPQYEPSRSADDDGCGQETYSPIERFSDDENESETGPSTSASAETQLSPPHKRLRTCAEPTPESPSKPVSPPRGLFSLPSPTLHPTLGIPDFVPVLKPAANVQKTDSEKENSSRIGWILQILSRLSQAEKPHEHLTQLTTTQALIRYLCETKDPLPRAGRVLLRLSK